MSIYSQLAQRNLGPGARVHELVSLESAAIEEHRLAEEAINELHEGSAEVEGTLKDFDKMSIVSGSLDHLIDNTIEAYGPDGLDKRGSELLSLSVEALLRAAGLPLQAAVIVPSFEDDKSRSEHTGNVAEKKDNVLRRIMAWLAAAWQAMTDSIARFVTRLRTSTASVEKYIEAVKARAAKAGRSIRTGKIRVGSTGFWMTTASGQGLNPVEALSEARKDYLTFIHGAETELHGIVSQKLPAATDESVNLWLNKLTESLGERYSQGLLRLDNVRFLPNMRFKVSHTAAVGTTPNHMFKADSSPHAKLVGATASVMSEKVKRITETDYMSIAQINEGLAIAEDFIKKLKTVEKAVDNYIATSKTAVTYLKRIDGALKKEFGKTPNTEQVATREGIQSFMAANAIYGKVYTLTIPHALTCIRQLTSLYDHNISALSVGELKTINTNTALRLGHDKPDGKSGDSHYAEFEHIPANKQAAAAH